MRETAMQIEYEKSSGFVALSLRCRTIFHWKMHILDFKAEAPCCAAVLICQAWADNSQRFCTAQCCDGRMLPSESQARLRGST